MRRKYEYWSGGMQYFTDDLSYAQRISTCCIRNTKTGEILVEGIWKKMTLKSYYNMKLLKKRKKIFQ